MDADTLKQEGNAAFAAHEFQRASELYSQAIALDTSNHVLFSNRSACYTNLRRYQDALKDAENATQLQPEWARGWQRLGDASFGMGDLEGAVTAYEKCLSLDPNNAHSKTQLEAVQKRMQDEAANPFGGMGNPFSDPNLLAKLATNPQTSAYMRQPDFLQKIQEIQANPAKINEHMNDQRILQAFVTLLGATLKTPEDLGMDMPSTSEDSAPKSNSPSTSSSTSGSGSGSAPSASASSVPAPEPELTEEEKELQEKKKRAAALKEEGNALYRKREFEEALAKYTEAKDTDPDDKTIVYDLNISAVFLEMQEYERCINVCEEAIARGREKFTPFEELAKAYLRIGNALWKMDKLEEALEAYNQSLTEFRTKPAQLKKMELEKLLRKRAEEAYYDKDLSLEARQQGNSYFKEQNYPEAIKLYTEAIKRDPTDHVPYSNRAACYIKLGEIPSALKDCEKALDINPEFARAWCRKGQCHLLAKEYHKALDAYERARSLEPENQEAMEGYMKTMMAINSGGRDPERVKRAMEDPEIQNILTDPAMNQILQQLQTDPKAAQFHLSQPAVREKLFKLQAAGVLQLG